MITKDDVVMMKYLLPYLETKRLERERKAREENPCYPFPYNQQFIDDLKKWYENQE